MGTISLLTLKRRAKESLRAQGITVVQWAKANGFNATNVYHFLNNHEVKGRSGEMYRIAVALGIKPRVETKLDTAA